MAKQTMAQTDAVKAIVKLNELQDPNGSVEFSQEQALQLGVELRTADPGTPTDGQIWLRSDLQWGGGNGYKEK